MILQMDDIYDVESALLSAIESHSDGDIVTDLAKRLVSKCLTVASNGLKTGKLRESYILLLKAENLTSTEEGKTNFFLWHEKLRVTMRRRCFTLLSEFERRRLYPTPPSKQLTVNYAARKAHRQHETASAAEMDISVVQNRTVSRQEYEGLSNKDNIIDPSEISILTKQNVQPIAAAKVTTSEDRLRRARRMREINDRREAERLQERETERQRVRHQIEQSQKEKEETAVLIEESRYLRSQKKEEEERQNRLKQEKEQKERMNRLRKMGAIAAAGKKLRADTYSSNVTAFDVKQSAPENIAAWNTSAASPDGLVIPTAMQSPEDSGRRSATPPDDPSLSKQGSAIASASVSFRPTLLGTRISLSDKRDTRSLSNLNEISNVGSFIIGGEISYSSLDNSSFHILNTQKIIRGWLARRFFKARQKQIQDYISLNITSPHPEQSLSLSIPAFDGSCSSEAINTAGKKGKVKKNQKGLAARLSRPKLKKCPAIDVGCQTLVLVHDSMSPKSDSPIPSKDQQMQTDTSTTPDTPPKPVLVSITSQTSSRTLNSEIIEPSTDLPNKSSIEELPVKDADTNSEVLPVKDADTNSEVPISTTTEQVPDSTEVSDTEARVQQKPSCESDGESDVTVHTVDLQSRQVTPSHHSEGEGQQQIQDTPSSVGQESEADVSQISSPEVVPEDHNVTVPDYPKAAEAAADAEISRLHPPPRPDSTSTSGKPDPGRCSALFEFEQTYTPTPDITDVIEAIHQQEQLSKNADNKLRDQKGDLSCKEGEPSHEETTEQPPTTTSTDATEEEPIEEMITKQVDAKLLDEALDILRRHGQVIKDEAEKHEIASKELSAAISIQRVYRGYQGRGIAMMKRTFQSIVKLREHQDERTKKREKVELEAMKKNVESEKQPTSPTVTIRKSRRRPSTPPKRKVFTESDFDDPEKVAEWQREYQTHIEYKQRESDYYNKCVRVVQSLIRGYLAKNRVRKLQLSYRCLRWALRLDNVNEKRSVGDGVFIPSSNTLISDAAVSSQVQLIVNLKKSQLKQSISNIEIVQSCCRSKLSKTARTQRLTNSSCITIQKIWKGYIIRSRHVKQSLSPSVDNESVEHMSDIRGVMFDDCDVYKSAIDIQRVIRGHLARNKIHKKKSTIQINPRAPRPSTAAVRENPRTEAPLSRPVTAPRPPTVRPTDIQLLNRIKLKGAWSPSLMNPSRNYVPMVAVDF